MIRLLVVLVAAAALAGCGGAAVGAANGAAAGPFDGLAACTGPPSEPVDVDVEVVLPPGTQVLESTVQGPLTFVTAYVEMTPVAIRLWFEDEGNVELLVSEDEIFEVELLFTDRVNRAYVKGAALCRTGTTLTVVVAAELEDAPNLVPDDAFPTSG